MLRYHSAGAVTNHSRRYTTARLGRLLPADPKHLNDCLTKVIEAAEQKKAPFHPVVEEFRAMIENDPEMYMYFTQMFEQQAPFAPPIGSGDIKLKNYQQMLVALNHVLTSAPEFITTGMVGCPINAVLDFPMITRAGLGAFLSPKVNAMLKKVLKVWTEFLIPVQTGRPVPFACGETHELGEELVGSYLTQVHLQHELESTITTAPVRQRCIYKG